MFEVFEKVFLPDRVRKPVEPRPRPHTGVPSFNELIARFGGSSFRGGLYRIIESGELAEWNERVSLAFPAFSKRVMAFGYDWLGRAFALNLDRRDRGDPGVTMFDPGSGEAFRIPCSIEQFHDQELGQATDAALAVEFYKEWRSGGGR